MIFAKITWDVYPIEFSQIKIVVVVVSLSPLTRAQAVVHANVWLIFYPSAVVQKLAML